MCGMLMMMCVACCKRRERQKAHSADHRRRTPAPDIYTVGVQGSEHVYNSALIYGAGLEGLAPSIPLTSDGAQRTHPDGPPPAYETMFTDNSTSDTIIDIKKDYHDTIDEKFPYPADGEREQQSPKEDGGGNPPSYEAAVSSVKDL